MSTFPPQKDWIRKQTNKQTPKQLMGREDKRRGEKQTKTKIKPKQTKTKTNSLQEEKTKEAIREI